MVGPQSPVKICDIALTMHGMYMYNCSGYGYDGIVVSGAIS